jgi:PAS domain S-box-containing protein
VGLFFAFIIAISFKGRRLLAMALNRYKGFLPYVILLVMLVISVLVWQLYEKNAMQREESRFFHSVNHAQNDLIDRIYRYEMVLQGGAGLFAASEEVTRDEFKAYCEYQQTVELYPGVQGVGYAKVVQPPDLASHLEEIKAEGFPDYKLWPEGDRDLYTAIIFLEPFDERNQRAFGFDMYSEPVRQAAMERVRDSGVAAISGKVKLVQEAGKDVQPGFLMYVPVYAKGLPLETPENRKAAIEGYVYAPFRMNDLIQNIFPDPNFAIDFEIYDGPEITSETLLYDSHISSVKHRPMFTSQGALDLYGHQWTVVFHSMPLFESAVDRFTPKGILAAGVLFSFLFFFYLQALERTIDQTRILNLALQKSKEKYRFLTENIQDVIWNIDLDGNLTYISPAIEKMIGFTPEEILERPLNDFIVEEDFNALFIKLTEELAKPPAERDISMTMTARHKTKDNRIVETEFNASWLFDDHGQTIGVQGSSRDIRERKKAEAKIRKLNEELEQRVKERTFQLEAVNEELEAFAYSVSHDLRAPLRAMDGFSGILQKEYSTKLDDQGRHYLERIQVASNRMGELINNLLTLSRVTRGSINYEQIDLSKLAADTFAALQEAEPKRKTRFEITPGLSARGDATLLQLVMENLLGNAWKFSANEKETRIKVGQTTIQGKEAFYICDNGAGFDMTYADKLFGAFQRLHRVEEFTGTGIGLATVQRIINRHGGKIWAESEVGNGATFYFTLPGYKQAE